MFLEVFYNCFTIPRFQDNFYKKSLPIINSYISPITLIDLHDNMTINICSVSNICDSLKSMVLKVVKSKKRKPLLKNQFHYECSFEKYSVTLKVLEMQFVFS